MAKILKGKEVADALTAQMKQDVEQLKAKGITPTLCIFRVGDRTADLFYEKSATKRAQMVGLDVRNVILPPDVSQEEFDRAFTEVNEDDSIHGILLFMPLPKHLDSEKARQMLDPAKDIDGCTDLSLAGVFTNTKTGFPPCTAQAVMEILHYYGIGIKGKKAALAGASGVGKSTILNRLHPEAQMETGNISRKSQRGKHTTRHSELFTLDEEGTMIFDTPGFTSFDILTAEVDELQFLYPEIGAFAGKCRYDNCRHLAEPECAVKQALEEGRISASRYRSYKEQMEELLK